MDPPGNQGQKGQKGQKGTTGAQGSTAGNSKITVRTSEMVHILLNLGVELS